MKTLDWENVDYAMFGGATDIRPDEPARILWGGKLDGVDAYFMIHGEGCEVSASGDEGYTMLTYVNFDPNAFDQIHSTELLSSDLEALGWECGVRPNPPCSHTWEFYGTNSAGGYSNVRCHKCHVEGSYKDAVKAYMYMVNHGSASISEVIEWAVRFGDIQK